jgi:hypothetical protein
MPLRTINEFFSEEPQKTLYHYTSISSLTSIAESKTIWASHIYYLNDISELTYAGEVMRDAIFERFDYSTDKEEQLFLVELSTWVFSTFKDTIYHLFIVALTEEGNLLSQWRSYTPHGKGVSIGFEPEFLLRNIKSQNLRIARCLYQASEQKELMQDLLSKILITFNRERQTYDSSHSGPSGKYLGIMNKFIGDLLQVFSIIKHPAFSEEKEWRIISPNFPECTVPQIKFREGASMLVPYIEVHLSNIREGETLFEEIYLGPAQYVNLSISTLSNYLSSRKLCNKLTYSDIPYREW